MKHVIAVFVLIATGYAQVVPHNEPYRSAESGIAYEPQSGWQAEERSEGGAFSVVFTSPDATSRVTFMVLSRALFADATVDNALPPADAGKRFRKAKSPKVFSVAGFSFVRADFQQEHAPVYQCRLMTDAGTWRVLVILSAPSQQMAEQLLGTLSSFAFSPPEPVKVLSDDRVLVDATVMQRTLTKQVNPKPVPYQTGTVNLRVIIGKDGKVKDVAVMSGSPVLSRSAVDAVKQWEFRPYYYKDQPIEVETRVTLNFYQPGMR